MEFDGFNDIYAGEAAVGVKSHDHDDIDEPRIKILSWLVTCGKYSRSIQAVKVEYIVARMATGAPPLHNTKLIVSSNSLTGVDRVRLAVTALTQVFSSSRVLVQISCNVRVASSDVS